MQLDDLKSVWAQEVEFSEGGVDFERVKREVDKFDREVKRAIAIEVFACVGLVLFCLYAWLTQELSNPMLQTGIVGMALVAVYIAVKVIRSQSVKTENPWTLSSKLNQQIEKREKEAKMLSSVASWYLSPLFVVIVMGSWGGYAQRTGTWLPDAGLWIYWGLCVLFYLAIYWVNRRRVRNEIQPLLNKLYSLREELERVVE